MSQASAHFTLSPIDSSLVGLLVFGGCCSNAWSLETLLQRNPRLGSALTFSQMLFIAGQALPSFITFHDSTNRATRFPRLKPTSVPLSKWLIQVVLLVAISLLNNMAFAFRVPLTVQIVFRSGGLAVSMIFGYLYASKRYNFVQIMAVVLVSCGVVLATLSRPSAPTTAFTDEDIQTYFYGVGLLGLSLLLSGVLGLLQEATYRKYGPYWREGVFYTHFLSLPLFTLFWPDVKQGMLTLSSSPGDKSGIVPSLYLFLVLNVVSQLMCVSGVNKLNSRVSSVTTNLVLTTRKALSLCLSVWYFGNGWNSWLVVGASLVLVGSFLYGLGSRSPESKGNKEL